MTTYREINDTEVAVDAPLTQQLMQALKDNVLAIQEGDSTASNVRINPKALTKTINVGDFTILRIGGLQSTQSTQTHRTIKFKFRIGGSVRVRARFEYIDNGSYDNSSWSVVKTASSDGSTSNIISGSDNSGSQNHDFNATGTFLADDSIHISIDTQEDASIKFHLSIGCDDKDILGQTVFYTDADDEITDTEFAMRGSTALGYSYSFI